jgi:hypothetical protein
MGLKDSSKTRVVPVFDRLFANDNSGKTWLPRLLSLPLGGHHINLLIGLDLTIQDKGWGDSEKKFEPPISLLSWLIRHPEKLTRQNLSSEPTERQELINGYTSRLREALKLLRNISIRNDWYVFEGKTQPDVFIETPDILIVIEGKRTEYRATTKTKWMPGRHQMIRHIDCAWEIKGKKRVIGFFIVEGEGGNPEVPELWMEQVHQTMSTKAMTSSLPHRGPEEQLAIVECFSGITTWQRLCTEFDIDWQILPH